MVGAFRIDGFLGRGATGEVYLATQLTPTRAVALKLLLDDFIGGAGLTREAELLASLEHPSIARLYQTGTVAAGGAERRYLAMQFVPGGRTLAEWASEAHDDTTCVRMMIAIAEAVAFAHGRGVIHLHVLGARVQGTLAYAAPEALDPASRPDVRADIFALGAILYELLARRAFRTFRSSDLTGMMAETIGTASPRLVAASPRFGGDLDRITAKATAQDPALRYASASQFAEDLRRHLAGEPVLAELQSPRERLVRALRRHRRVVAISALIAGLLVATTSISLTFARSARHEARLANLSAAARAIDAGDLMLVEQHAEALGADDGSIERAIIERAIGLRGATIAEGDWYAMARTDANGVLAVGYPPGSKDGPILARFERESALDAEIRGAPVRWRRMWSTAANPTVTNTVAVSADSARVAVIDADCGIVVLEVADGTVLATIPCDEPIPNSCAIALASDGTIAIARSRLELRPIDNPARVIAAIDPGVGSLRAIAFSPSDPRLVAVAGHGGAVLLERSDDGLRVATRFETPQANQVALHWTPDGRRLAIGGWDRTVRLHDPLQARPLWTARGHHDAVWSIEIDARTEPARILSAGADGSLRLWRIEDGSAIATIPFADDIVWSLAAAPDGSLATASQGALTLAQPEARDAWIGRGSIDPLSRTGRALRVEPSTAARPEPRLSEVATGLEKRLPPIPGEGAVSRVAIAPDDATVLVLRACGTISLVETATARVRWSTTALCSEDIHEPQGIPSLALDGVDHSAYVASRTLGCVALDARDGCERWRRPIGASCTDVAASVDGTRVFAADRDGLVVALDAHDGGVLAESRRQRTRASCMAVTLDGSRLVTGGADGTMRILDANTLEEQMMLLLSQEQLRSLWFESDAIHAVDRVGILRIR
ncbi:MAG: serine/threonine-protein kinase [Planctomycetaceae bacterium]|nr:serine/threonine-protein kinase [Planctomycetaceae bacterium]